MSAEEEPSRPPAPPEMRRRIQLRRSQWIGIAVLFSIPLAALAGAFGERMATVNANADGAEVSATVPSVLRYRQTKQLRISIANRGTAPLDSPAIAFDTAYVLAFSNLQFTPTPDERYVVTLAPLAPRQSGVAILEFQADRYGRHQGQLRVRAGGATLTLPLRTWILP